MAGKHETVEEEEGNANIPNRKSLVSVAREHSLAASLQSFFSFSSWRERAATSSSVYSSTRIQRMMQRRSGFATEVEFEIDASRDHWSELQLDASSGQEDKRKRRQHQAQTNAEIVKSLQRQWPATGLFFDHFRDDMRVGAKIAEGGQAEIFEVEEQLDDGFHFKTVLKVFKEGVSVRDLQRQLPPGMLQQTNGWYWSLCSSPILCGTVVMNGRFAFKMQKRWGDLRKLIDFRMQLNQHPPFSNNELLMNMLDIAQGMKGLHEHNIVHRDLKASNVLIEEWNESEGRSFGPSSVDLYFCEVADYECSVGVVGTRFWRAPEILEAVKNRNVTSNLFTEKSDVYSFAMTCYEMITGQLPFEGVRLTDYDVVLRGDRPTLPKDTKPWIKDLLNTCWHVDPLERPNFQDIVELIDRYSQRRLRDRFREFLFI